MTNGCCPSCSSPLMYEYCECCGCDFGSSPSPLPKSPDVPKEDLEKTLEKLYDLCKDPNRDEKEVSRLMAIYKNLTGEEAPKFWV